jgi:hypothetical protein
MLTSWKTLTKRAGSGSVNQVCRSKESDPDPYQMSRIRNAALKVCHVIGSLLFHYYMLREELDGLKEGRSERSRRESSDSRFSSDRDLGPVFLDQVSASGSAKTGNTLQAMDSVPDPTFSNMKPCN